MSVNEIPVRVVGPGSQETGEALSYMRMPSGMSTYVQPEIPDADRVAGMEGAREAMTWLRHSLAGVATAKQPARASLAALDPESRDIVNQVLGEGEVSITYANGLRARTQESVLAGVWRTFVYGDDETVVADVLEVADVPAHVRAGGETDSPVNADPDGVPGEMTNALSILVELAAHVERFEKDAKPAVINLSLLPLSEEEVEFIDERLGRGAVDILSRAYGKCQIISTKTRNVWWVRYYNSMNTLILNTLEVVAVPEVVCAAPEDLADSATRLDEILAPYGLADG